MFMICLSVRPSVCYQSCEHKPIEPISMKIDTKGNETINFWGQEVKDQGHTTLKLDLETFRKHHSRPPVE